MTIDLIKEEVVTCRLLGITPTELFSGRRFKDLVKARHLVWYFMYYKREMTQEYIGYRYGIDHSTVGHGIQKVIAQKDNYFRVGLREINKLLEL